ncbi:helix-turn-helix domain-containing protein, partial [Flavobacterium sp.]|uniref:helix-turn-helix domain-containing protein n=1 Tax=Flavobacterium sp. TaxID=239 RepID=UPI0037531695
MESNNRYLDANFGLDVLSNELSIGISSLSHTINQNSEYNFTDYINSLRIEKAKSILIDSNYKNYTINAIGLECGFYSKSTFYTAFKKFTSTTPTNFK